MHVKRHQHPDIAGDGFVTNQAVVAQSGVSDATAFFNDLVTKPYVQQFIVGPHIYCADVSGSSYATSGQALYSKLSTTFGYLNLKGRQRINRKHKMATQPLLIGGMPHCMHC